MSHQGQSQVRLFCAWRSLATPVAVRELMRQFDTVLTPLSGNGPAPLELGTFDPTAMAARTRCSPLRGRAPPPCAWHAASAVCCLSFVLCTLRALTHEQVQTTARSRPAPC